MKFQEQGSVSVAQCQLGKVLIGAVCKKMKSVGFDVTVSQMVYDRGVGHGLHVPTALSGQVFSTRREAKAAARRELV